MLPGSTRRNVNPTGNSRRDSSPLSLPNQCGARNNIVRKPITTFPKNQPPVGKTETTNNIPETPAIPPGPKHRPPITIETGPTHPQANGRPTTSQRPKFDPMRSFRNSFLGKQVDAVDPEDTVRPSKGKGKASVDESLERAMQSKLAAKAREIREWMKGKSGSEMHISATDAFKKAVGNEDTIANQTRARQAVGGMRDLFKNRKLPTHRRKDRGPKAGQTYEIVDRRIIENNPERTVEISTWREQPIDNTKANEDERLDIYYISADEYLQEGEYANETAAKVEWRMDASEMPLAGMDYSQTGLARSTAADVSHKSLQSQRPLRGDIDLPSPGARERTISPSTSEKEPSSSAKTPKAQGIEVTVEHVDQATGGSSTPVKRPHHRGHRQRRRFESAPSEKELPRSPFHLSRSGSTVSTVKSNPSIQFESILRSCEPSLTHIAPVLRKLGIQKIEHLRAIARLTPVIRDREVKENALKQGVTVLEWAILLDKLTSL